jgi:hypothetical protein
MLKHLDEKLCRHVLCSWLHLGPNGVVIADDVGALAYMPNDNNLVTSSNTHTVTVPSGWA